MSTKNELRYGIVKWFNGKKGYGFITEEGMRGDAIVHHTNINMDGFRMLHEGQRVRYRRVRGERGMEAHDVQVVR